MTSPTSVDIPAPADWQHFERLSRAVFSEAFSANFNRFGRAGQRQNGIDVLGRLPTGALIGVQCKGRTSSMGKQLTKKQVDDAIAAAETYPGQLDAFYIVTTAKEDAVLQQYVIDLSGVRKAAGKFEVTLWGWQSMSDQIRSCPGVMKTFYGHWWRKPSLKFIAAAVMLTTVIGFAGFLGSRRVEQWFQVRDAGRSTTVAGLQQVVSTLDQLQVTYGNCIESMAGKAFMFSGQLRDSCTKPIELPLQQLGRQRDHMAGVMNADAYAEVVAASDYLNEDFRQLLVAADMSQGFERSAVDYAKTACPNPKFRTAAAQDGSKLLRRSGEDALSAQMAQYFRMRDFAVPAIAAMKARLAVASRLQNGQDVTQDLVQKANSLASLLQEERSFSYKLPASPFATARVKQMSTRTLTVSGPALDPVDDIVWSQTAENAMFEGLHGHGGDVEFLISCGLLKPTARVLEDDTGKKASS
ncbi:hypothetical protein PQR37_37575 [Paraburkholderia nemoris]|uniref:hypothetical protein n=1 Tax=Paraburkholderia nemoris TaxID=2793076 RepID=UPI0038BDAFEA